MEKHDETHGTTNVCRLLEAASGLAEDDLRDGDAALFGAAVMTITRLVADLNEKPAAAKPVAAAPATVRSPGASPSMPPTTEKHRHVYNRPDGTCECGRVFKPHRKAQPALPGVNGGVQVPGATPTAEVPA